MEMKKWSDNTECFHFSLYKKKMRLKRKQIIKEVVEVENKKVRI